MPSAPSSGPTAQLTCLSSTKYRLSKFLTTSLSDTSHTMMMGCQWHWLVANVVTENLSLDVTKIYIFLAFIHRAGELFPEGQYCDIVFRLPILLYRSYLV